MALDFTDRSGRFDWAAVRHHLHRNPELSGQEGRTARFLQDLIQGFQPDQVIAGLGGTGLAFVFRSQQPGPCTLIRCELDGLPIPDTSGLPYQSCREGIGHQCGHDGHMTIVAALAEDLACRRPRQGQVVLLYQPAEETGAGAARVVADPAFAALQPDFAFTLHNVPGLSLGEVAIRPGPITCASGGMIARLRGATSHAAYPENGLSPALPMTRIMQAIDALPSRFGPGHWATLVHARLGEYSFGVSPGTAEVLATLRSESDQGMAQLVKSVEELVAREADDAGLEWDIAWEDEFTACVNDATACQQVVAACLSTGIPCSELDGPFRWSEDFGRIAAAARSGAFFALGSGPDSPQLHNSHYDFPDSLIPIGRKLFRQLVDQING